MLSIVKKKITVKEKIRDVNSPPKERENANERKLAANLKKKKNR